MPERRKAISGIIEISPPLGPDLAVFPGDTAFRRKVDLDFKTGGNLLLSSITTSLHIGAHADAPNHYHPDGVGIDQREIDRYIGECQVMTVKLPRGERVTPADLPGPVMARRILFRTGSFSNPSRWTDDFNALSPELVSYLATHDVVLVGIDTPSIDPAGDKKLLTHQIVYQKNMAVLEGLVLNDAPDGLYSLIALPLRIQGGDASPVRAILLTPEAREALWKR
jgi:arylformamidase